MNEIIFWTGIWSTACNRPIGVYQLAHWLRKHNINCQVIDFCQWYSPEVLVNLTSKFISNKTKYIGISTAFWFNSIIPSNILESYKLIKKEYPNIKFVLGGPRADASNLKEIADIIISGEAEENLVTLIKGHNLNILKFDITKLDHRFVEQDCIIDGEILPIELGRGCVFKCKFCGHHNIGKPKHTYQRNSDLLMEEILYNYKNFKTTRYMFLDDTINEDVDKVKMLAEIPNHTKINLQWVGYLRADLLWRYPDTPYLLKQSGLQSCFFGIESFHKNASAAIGKGWSSNYGKTYLPKLYHEIWNEKINLWCNFIVGLPGETLEEINNTVAWCKENDIGHHNFASLTLYTSRTDNGPKSEFTRNYKDYGYTLDNNYYWISPIMTEMDAVKLCKTINISLYETNRLSSWLLSDAVNCNIDMVSGQSLLSSNREKFINNFQDFLSTYKTKLLQL